MLYKENWEQVKERYEAFWNRDCIDRPMLIVHANKTKGVERDYEHKKVDPVTKWTDINYILDEKERMFENTYFAAEALPTYIPDLGPGILAAFLGAEPNFQQDTVWFNEIIEDWETYKPYFNEENQWWKKIISMTEIALERAKGKYLVGFTDFHGAGDNISNMRGPQNFCIDFYEYPDEIKETVKYITDMLIKCSKVTSDMILKQQEGTTTWMGVWARGRHDVVQADIGALIGPNMFEEFFREEFEKYIDTLDRSIFHVDGPDMIKHIDMLLEIPKLDAIQWVPGDGQPEAIAWIPMLKKIQEKGKSLYVYSSSKNVEGLLKELSPKGLCINVIDRFKNEDKAEEFIKKVKSWSRF